MRRNFYSDYVHKSTSSSPKSLSSLRKWSLTTKRIKFVNVTKWTSANWLIRRRMVPDFFLIGNTLNGIYSLVWRICDFFLITINRQFMRVNQWLVWLDFFFRIIVHGYSLRTVIFNFYDHFARLIICNHTHAIKSQQPFSTDLSFIQSAFMD